MITLFLIFTDPPLGAAPPDPCRCSVGPLRGPPLRRKPVGLATLDQQPPHFFQPGSTPVGDTAEGWSMLAAAQEGVSKGEASNVAAAGDPL